MGFDSLKGYTPEKIKDDGGFDVFKVKNANAEITYIRIEDYSGKTPELQGTRWLSYELTITDDPQFSGRKLWKRMNLDNDAQLKKIADLMFTLLNVSISSEDELQACCEQLAGKTAKVSAWGWTPDKDMDGSEIPVDQRTARQMHKLLKVIEGSEEPVTTSSSQF